MKKGISLIVLVITIIVMIIIAGAIIISLNSTNLIQKADDAVITSDAANLKSELTLKYAEVMLYNEEKENDQNVATEPYNKETVQGYYNDILKKYDRLVDNGYKVTISPEEGNYTFEVTPKN